jgi:two-component system sensor histidine kinase KdpD
LAALACTATALIATPLRPYLDLVNIVMLFLLTVFLVSLRLGKQPAVLAAFLSVALFDFFFVPPRLTFAVADAQYLVTFIVMLAVALVTGQLTAGLRRQAGISAQEARRNIALYEMAKSLSGAMTLGHVIECSQDFLRDVIGVKSDLLLPGEHGELVSVGKHGVWYEPHVALMAYGEDRRPHRHPLTELDGVRYYTLHGSTRTRGVLVVSPLDGDIDALDADHALLEAVASLIAIALERLHYVDVAQVAQVDMASERLRSSILSALSHDLRTPLTILYGQADALALAKPPLPEKQQQAADAIREQSLRLCSLVENLLDMARLHAGQVKLRKEWQPLEEVVGAAIKLLERSLAGHTIRTALPPDLPLLEFDAVLIERVLCNLLENAVKYSPEPGTIEIKAKQVDTKVEIAVCDNGPGIPEARREKLFDMFVRGSAESPLPGVGLGLAICRAIVEAHGGEIRAEDRPEGGTCFVFTLPVGDPPVIEEESPLPEVSA